jgi:hypothetical protein
VPQADPARKGIPMVEHAFDSSGGWRVGSRRLWRRVTVLAT